ARATLCHLQGLRERQPEPRSVDPGAQTETFSDLPANARAPLARPRRRAFPAFALAVVFGAGLVLAGVAAIIVRARPSNPSADVAVAKPFQQASVAPAAASHVELKPSAPSAQPAAPASPAVLAAVRAPPASRHTVVARPAPVPVPSGVATLPLETLINQRE